MLILAQRPDATTVAGYRAWQSLGRQVRRGAKGIGIFGYSTKTSVQEVTDSTGHTDEKTTTRTFFPVRTVFDISDTDGDDITVPTDVHTCVVDEQDASTRAYQRISAWLIELGWDVQRANIPGAVRGYTSHADKLLRISDELDDINAARVLLHEAAHVILHGPDSGFITTEQYAASRAHRGAAEIQADGAAYVLADLLGLDTATPPSGTSQAGQPPPPAAPPTPRRSPPRSAAPRPPSCTPSTPSPRRSAWTTENNPRACPVRYRAGQAPGRQPKGHFRGTRVGTTRYPPRRPHPIPAAPAATGRGAQRGRRVVGGCPYVANIKTWHRSTGRQRS